MNKAGNYVIRGVFQEDLGSPGNIDFNGRIELSEDGSFTGYTNDRYGHATITGNIVGTEFKFVKKYGAEARGAKQLITYQMQSSSVDLVEAGIFRDWKGTYRFSQGGLDSEDFAPRNASCRLSLN
jgi:hypothetical protein